MYFVSYAYSNVQKSKCVFLAIVIIFEDISKDALINPPEKEDPLDDINMLVFH